MRAILILACLSLLACSDDGGGDNAPGPDTGDDIFLGDGGDDDGADTGGDAGDGGGDDADRPDTDSGDDTPDTPDGDQTDPMVTLTAPVDGQVVEDAFDVLAEASDNVGVVSVAFYVDDEAEPRATLDAQPYSATIAIDTLDGGNHNLRAVATDAAGNTGSDTAVFVIDNPPTVAFLAPLDGETIAGPTFEIRLDVADDVALDRAEIFVDDTSIGEATNGTLTWNIPFARADYALRAIAHDEGGQTAEAAIAVSVDHPATVTLQLCNEDPCQELPTELLSEPVTLGALFADDDEHDNLSVVFTINGDIIDEAIGPYVAVWDASTVEPGVHTLGARAVAGELLAETEVEVRVLAPRTCQEACRVTLACREEICIPDALPTEQECLIACSQDDWDLAAIVDSECAPLNGAFCRGGGREVEGCQCEAFPDPTCEQVCGHVGTCLPDICGDLLPVDLFVQFCVFDCQNDLIDPNLIDAQCPQVNESVCEVNQVIQGLCMCPEQMVDCEAACTRAEDNCLSRICPDDTLDDAFHAECVTACENDTLPHDTLARGMCRAVDEAVCGALPGAEQACACPVPAEGCAEACDSVSQCAAADCNNLPPEILTGFCTPACERGAFAPSEVANLTCEMQIETLCQSDQIVPNLCMCPPAREANTGAPCVGDDDCSALDAEPVCIQGDGFVDGYCSTVGCVGSYQCGAGGVCLDPLGIPICAARCDPFEGTGCREGYACARVDGLRGACTPVCADNADCGQFLQCDQDLGTACPDNTSVRTHLPVQTAGQTNAEHRHRRRRRASSTAPSPALRSV